ncbi:REP-associated tyrosine transposase [Pontibacillus yanchengensis]|uniref:Transposase IS200-like domain-containing protein n=1 Tax=Pontibacillus yanchengensis Y32 TaxID=1385514 RepID=A0A0A2TIY9_9BACI|nr:transposase [Pontibacillus yanchengensis]KGP74051.1 hypothetical protein N782_17060 [Pontibacillus yanchengensis Y32]
MSRPIRVWYRGAQLHITARGNRKGHLFYGNEDYETYLHLLKKCQEESPFTILSYCLMPNHIHLLVELQNHSPGEIMKFIQFRYAKYFNKKYDFSGHVFQGRYHSKLIESTHYLKKVSKYIHLNPVKAGLSYSPDTYRWSSYPLYVDMNSNHGFIEIQTILDLFQEPQISNYKEYILSFDEGEV